MSGSATLYSDYLVREGYHPTIDSDGDVIFKHEGKTYYIDVDMGDPQYFRLVYPLFWSIDSTEELALVLFAANHATAVTKVAKVYVLDDGKNASAAIEMFLERPEQFSAVFRRSMSALQASIRNFLEKMRP